jgi:predicted membrane-bound spermidine synthase
MRRCLILIGLTGLVTAVLSFREVLQIAGGNELIWPGAMAGVLFGLMLGGIAEKISERWQPSIPFFSLLLLLAGCSTPTLLLAVRGVRHLHMSPTGAVAIALLLCAAPFLVIGALHGLAGRILSRSGAALATHTLPYVGLGSAAGGAVLFFLLLANADSLRIALAVTALDAVAAFVIWGHTLNRPAWGWLLPVPAVLAVAAMVTPYAHALDFLSCSVGFDHDTLAAVEDSPMGRTVVMETPAGTSLHYNGLLLGQAPHRDDTVQAALMALLSHRLPRRMLFIGGAADDWQAVIKEFPWLVISLTHYDPAILRVELDEAGTGALPDRVIPEYRMDARRVVRDGRGQYDVIALALPPGSSVLANRLLTRRFFEEARDALAEEGVLGVVVAGGPDVEQSIAAKAVEESLRSTFATVAIGRGGDSGFALASREPAQGFPSAGLWRRRAEAWRLANARALLRDFSIPWETKAYDLPLVPSHDTDLHPFIHWLNAKFPVLADKTDLSTSLIAVAAIVGVLAMGTAFSAQPWRIGAFATRSVISAAGAGLLLALLLALQALSGHAWSAMALLFGSVMLGAGLGKGISSSIAAADIGRGAATVFQMAFGVVCAACAPVMAQLGLARANASVVIGVMTAVAFAVGLSAGLASGTSVRPVSTKPARSRNAAGISAFPEMLGGMIGVCLAGFLFVPAIGLPLTCMVLSAAVFLALPLPILALRSR